MTRLLAFADTHVGHYCGLTPPPYQIEPAALDDPRSKYLINAAKLWRWWDTKIHKVMDEKPIDIAIFDGDALEGKGERSGGCELITTDRERQAEMFASIIHGLNIKRLFMAYGTSAHGGKEEDWERVAAEKAGAESIGAEIHLDINDLIIEAKHTMSNTKSPISMYTPMQRERLIQSLWAEYGQQPNANIIIRAHTHRCLVMEDPNVEKFVVSLPGLQGLGSKYGSREYGGLPVSFGFVIIDIERKGQVSIKAYLAPLKMQAAHVTKIS